MWFACVSSSVSGPIMTSRTVCRASVRLAGFKKRLLSSTRLLLRDLRGELDEDWPGPVSLRLAHTMHPVDLRDVDRGRDAHHMV